jgi:hypothetical protein
VAELGAGTNEPLVGYAATCADKTRPPLCRTGILTRVSDASDTSAGYRYEGFRHDASWVAIPPPEYLASTVSDLRCLSATLQGEAILVDQGEATWPAELVPMAVNALADLGRPVRGLVAPIDDAGRLRVLAIATEGDVEVTRGRMLEVVSLLMAGERGTVMWQVV